MIKKKSIRWAGTTVLCTALMVMTFFLCVTTAAAWSDFMQSKTNVFSGTVEKTKVTLHKYEMDQNGNATEIPVQNAEIALYKLYEDGTEEKIGDTYITDQSGKITIEKLNMGDYKFVETKPGYGYDYATDNDGNPIKEYQFTITSEDALGYAIKNVEAFNIRKTSGLEVNKIVLNADGSDLTEEQREKEFEFKVLFGDGNSYQYQINDTDEIKSLDNHKLWLKHGEKAVFKNVPVGVYYNVIETWEQSYSTESTNNQGNIQQNMVSIAEFINTYRAESDLAKTKITVTKIVKGEIPESEKEREFWFTFQKNDEEPVRFSLKAGEEKSFILNAGDIYSCTEDDPFRSGYIQTSVAYGAGIAEKPEIIIAITNTYIGTVRTNIQGEKKWEMNGAPESDKPKSIIVQLKNSDELVQSKIVTPDKNGIWRYEFTAPKYDDNGNEINYRIEEIPVQGFTSKVDGYNIINKRVLPEQKTTEQESTEQKPPEETSPKQTPSVRGNAQIVKKVIKGHRPETASVFMFTLTAMNGGPMPEDSDNETKTITIFGDGEADFGNIFFTTPGEYVYTVQEVKGADTNYTYDNASYILIYKVIEIDDRLRVTKICLKSGETEAVSKAEFTNTYRRPPDNTVVVNGLKKWNHGDNPESNRPTSIIVYVKKGNTMVAEKEVTAADHWMYQFELPKYEEDGKTVIQYTIEEGNVPNYTHQVDKYNLINTYKGQDYPGDSPPGTGDTTNISFWVTAILASIAVIIICGLPGRRNKHKRRTKYLHRKP